MNSILLLSVKPSENSVATKDCNGLAVENDEVGSPMEVTPKQSEENSARK